MENKRLTVGLFLADVADDFSRGICRGAMQAAEELDVNMIIFPGKYIDRNLEIFDGIQYDYQYNTLFTYVNPEEIDLLVVTIGSIGYLSTDKRRKKFLDYFGSIPIITIASEIEGYENIMYDNASGCLAAVEYLLSMGRRKITCMAGYMDNCEARERLTAWKETLERHGLELGEQQIRYCNMSRFCREEVEQLIDQNPELDAILCVNDEVAYCVYEVLQERGVRIGEDIAVVGYDDLSYAYRLQPSLATVRADATRLGEQAVREGICHLLKGQPIEHRVPVTFIPRASAGAPEETMSVEYEPLTDMSIERFLADNHAVNMITRDMFNFDKYADQNYATLLERLYMLQIQNAYLWLFPVPVIHLQEENWRKPERLLLKAYSCEGNVMAIPKHCQEYSVQELCSHEYLPNRRYTMVLLDLFTTDTQYGLLMMEMNYDKNYYLESLSYQMSAAVRMLKLLHNQEDIQKQLEDSLYQLELHNIQLDSASKRDELTGLLNRRGLESQVERVLRDVRNQGKYLLAVYADMDNLKIVNDRFGHKEGDFALRSIAGMLKQIFDRNTDIIGRIGGDEFVVFVIRETPIDMNHLRKQAAECMAAFNEKCEKPYYVRMTLGGYTQSFTTGCRFSDLLEYADSDLYEAKKLRTKDIMKV